MDNRNSGWNEAHNKRIIHIISVVINITITLVLGMAVSIIYDRGLRLLEEQDIDGIKYIIVGTLLVYIMHRVNKCILEGRVQKSERHKNEIV